MPGLPVSAGPRVQGHYYDFSSVEIMLGPLGLCLNIPDIAYSQKLDPGVFRGSGAMIRGRTRGTYDSDGSFSIYKEDYDALCAALSLIAKGGGYMTAVFAITVMYREVTAVKTSVDVLRGCRIVSEDYSLSSGNSAAIVKVGLSVMQVLSNKLVAVRSGNPVADASGF